MLNSELDSFYTGDLFQAFFKTSGQSLILKANAPVFTILAASDIYLALTYKNRSEILNKGLFEVYPGNHADPSEKNSVFSSFKRVTETKLPDVLPTFKYEIYVKEVDRFSSQYWSTLNEPLVDSEGNVSHIINTTANIAEQMLATQELAEARQMKETYTYEQSLNEELLVYNENLALDNAQLGIEQQILRNLITKLTESEAKVEQAELTLRLAIEAANVGTWYIHCPNRDLRVSARAKTLLGFFPEETVTLQEFVEQVTDDHRLRIEDTVERAMLTVGPYDESYPVKGFHDQKIRWLRALGNTSVQHGGFLAFTGVIMDISDLKADELRKNDFIGMVSHELKSPLTALSGYRQILSIQAQKSDNALGLATLNKIDIQVKKMTSMINGFLSKGRLESGKIHLQYIEFNIDDLVNELIEDIRLTTISHMVNIGRCDTVKVFADRDKIGNVITNLLSNAIKYSPKGKYIEVNCAKTNGRVQVSVKDEGLGMLPKDMATVFERYNRIKTTDTENIAGFGIGLYLCAEIVRHHHGNIWVESESGIGSTFFFDLPFND